MGWMGNARQCILDMLEEYFPTAVEWGLFVYCFVHCPAHPFSPTPPSHFLSFPRPLLLPTGPWVPLSLSSLFHPLDCSYLYSLRLRSLFSWLGVLLNAHASISTNILSYASPCILPTKCLNGWTMYGMLLRDTAWKCKNCYHAFIQTWLDVRSYEVVHLKHDSASPPCPAL